MTKMLFVHREPVFGANRQQYSFVSPFRAGCLNGFFGLIKASRYCCVNTYGLLDP